ncbi:MAG: hypothetical protein JNN32_04435 [Flavobacteriales bacterium]|nr:hypothetical protein [Flavobacteriales bacterium]
MNQLIKYAGVLYALLVFFGYVNLHTYYTSFGIDIWTFLSTSDMLLSFLSFTLPLLWYVTIGYLLFLIASVQLSRHHADPLKTISAIVVLILDRFGMIEVEEQNPMSVATSPLRQHVAIHKTKWFGLLYILGMLSMFLGYRSAIQAIYTGKVRYTIPLFEDVFIWAGALIFTFMMLAFYVEYEKPSILILLFVGLLLNSVMLVNRSNRMNAMSIMEGEIHRKACVETEDIMLCTDTNLVYLGKTSEYVFMYRRDRSMSLAIPVSVIHSVESENNYEFGKVIRRKRPSLPR